MVDFRFDIKPLFTQPIIKVSSNLLPHTFSGDRRQCLDATSKMSEIIDSLGVLSATAQKLQKPVTTAQRLRLNESQVIYLLADPQAGPNGQVIGLLKVGTKDLYLLDEYSVTRRVLNTPAILDFYIHESRQRAGHGKRLYQAMLDNEGWSPVKCSIDRPSPKLIGFLKKHYNLVHSIPQANNFVLYKGFFGNDRKSPLKPKARSASGDASLAAEDKLEIIDFNESLKNNSHRPSPNYNQPNNCNSSHQNHVTNNLVSTTLKLSNEQTKSPLNPNLNKLLYPNEGLLSKRAQIHTTGAQTFGRYAARRPPCSMAEVFNYN